MQLQEKQQILFLLQGPATSVSAGVARFCFRNDDIDLLSFFIYGPLFGVSP
jgi:hypothetical protein